MFGQKETNMTFEQFAEKHRLRINTDPADGTPVIWGHRGKSHVYEYGEGILGVMILPETGSSHWWTAARKAFLAAGMQIRQNGDFEGAATFDPQNPEQVKVALKHADVRPRREVSPAQREALTKARAMARPEIPVQTPAPEAVLAPFSSYQGSDDLRDCPERL